MATRDRYHHGDLANALLASAYRLARSGGPGAVVLREVTREVGVTVNAAYRHYRDRAALLEAVVARAQAGAAGMIEARLAGAGPGAPRLRAVGAGYIDFARAEPGLFETAFMVPIDLSRAADPRAAGPGGRTPFQLLQDALDSMVGTGELPQALRAGAEVPCWSAVHGFGTLAVMGPLRSMPTETVDLLAARTVEVAVRGVILAP